MENHFAEVKRPQIHLLMSFNSIRIMDVYRFGLPKNYKRVTGDGCLVFPAPAKLFLDSLSPYYCSMENHFSEVNKTSNSVTYELQ